MFYQQVSEAFETLKKNEKNGELLRMAVKNNQYDIIDWFFLQREKLFSKNFIEQLEEKEKEKEKPKEKKTNHDKLYSCWTDEEWKMFGKEGSLEMLQYIFEASYCDSQSRNGPIYFQKFITMLIEFDRADFFQLCRHFNVLTFDEDDHNQPKLLSHHFIDELKSFVKFGCEGVDLGELIGLYDARKIFCFLTSKSLGENLQTYISLLTLIDVLITKFEGKEDEEKLNFYLDFLKQTLKEPPNDVTELKFIFKYNNFSSLKIFKLVYNFIQRTYKSDDGGTWFVEFAHFQTHPPVVQWILHNTYARVTDFIRPLAYNYDFMERKSVMELIHGRLKEAQNLEMLIVLLQNIETSWDSNLFVNNMLTDSALTDEQLFRLLIRNFTFAKIDNWKNLPFSTKSLGKNLEEISEKISEKISERKIKFHFEDDEEVLFFEKVENVKQEIKILRNDLSTYFPSSVANLILLNF